MTPLEYKSAKATLGWSHTTLAAMLGMGLRCSFRYASGEIEIPNDRARLLRLYVLLRLSVSERKFNELLEGL